MTHLDWIPFAFGLIMASLDATLLSVIKIVSKDQAKLIRWMVIPTILYAIQPWIFLGSLQFESMIVMNLMWDLISNILVTGVGFLYFKESIGPYKKLGVIFSFLSIFLMSIADGDDFIF